MQYQSNEIAITAMINERLPATSWPAHKAAVERKLASIVEQAKRMGSKAKFGAMLFASQAIAATVPAADRDNTFSILERLGLSVQEDRLLDPTC
jgi:hypothetical protein